MAYNLQYLQFNSYSILIEWPAIIDENILKDILSFQLEIKNLYSKQKVEVINTYSSILIIYDFTIDKFNSIVLTLKSLYSSLEQEKSEGTLIWEIPVCYNQEFGCDLEDYSNKKNLSVPEIIQLHSDTIYTVFSIGFLPGFLYLGGLDSRLHLDRKSVPNLNVKKGSVAIGGNQTGIYPQDSPGGWHIIGRSPVELFNSSKNPPCFIKAGDKIKFNEVDLAEYKKIKDLIRKSNYQIIPIVSNA